MMTTQRIKSLISHIPIVGPAARRVYLRVTGKKNKFDSSENYWKQRYVSGGNSGAGSYGLYASFKADALNEFVRAHSIRSVIEHGCGDGNQLASSQYPEYLGLDISPIALTLCRQKFQDDPTKSFLESDAYSGQQADLAMSLDVIYHLVEDEIFEAYMRRLFDSSTRYVAIYSSNSEKLNRPGMPSHVRHRQFTDWIERHAPGWTMMQHIPNCLPYDPQSNRGSFAEFYFFSHR